MSITTTALAATMAGGLLFAGGTAFTASNTVDDSVLGYGTSTVSGATVSATAHTLNAAGTHLATTNLTFTTSQVANTVKVSVGSGDLLDICDESDASAPYVVTCTYVADSITAASVSTFNVSVNG